MQTRSLGPFELEEQIGSGAMGVVYRARYGATGQYVAVKLLSPEVMENEKVIARFKRELEILKKLKHPNIVLSFGGGRIGTERFYAMELVEGGSLAEMLQKEGKLPWRQVVEYGKQICAALHHAHQNGVVHRDLKPANLMLDKSGNIKLADFGLARLSDAAALTAAGKTMGTYAYMAPEQISGKSQITGRTDLYALGIVFYELITGRTPFQGKSIVEMLTQHLTKQPPRVCVEGLDCPAWFEKVIFHLLEKDPGKRPPDAEAVARALDAPDHALPDDTATTRRASTQSAPPVVSLPSIRTDDHSRHHATRKVRDRNAQPPFWKQIWVWAIAAAVLIGIIVGMMWPRGQQTPQPTAPIKQPVRKSTSP